jgi:hypothetical protein
VTAKNKTLKVTSIGGQMSIDTDLDQRDYWLAYLRQRSLQVLAERFFVSTTAIWIAETKQLKCRTARQNAEIQRLRSEYHLAKANEMPKYRIKAIASRNRVQEDTVYRRRHKRIANKARAVYQNHEVRQGMAL